MLNKLCKSKYSSSTQNSGKSLECKAALIINMIICGLIFYINYFLLVVNKTLIILNSDLLIYLHQQLRHLKTFVAIEMESNF